MEHAILGWPLVGYIGHCWREALLPLKYESVGEWLVNAGIRVHRWLKNIFLTL